LVQKSYLFIGGNCWLKYPINKGTYWGSKNIGDGFIANPYLSFA